jgi:AcrR family transcriptional regulator
MGDIDPAAASTEEFGSGLRAHLARRDDTIEPTGVPSTPRVPIEPRPAEGPSRNELELMAAELEERSARLTRLQENLQAREQRLAEELAALNAAARLNVPDPAPEPAPTPSEPRAASEELRNRLEGRIDLLWRTFEESLEATNADGTADYRTRLDAARMLLGAAYPTDSAAPDSTPAADEERLEDELARLRDRRLEWGKSS